MILRTAGGKAKNGVTSCQARRQLGAMGRRILLESASNAQGHLGLIGGRGLVNPAQVGVTALRSFQPQKFSEWRTRCTMQVWTVAIGKAWLMASGVFQAVDDGDQDVFDPTIAQIRSLPRARIWPLHCRRP